MALRDASQVKNSPAEAIDNSKVGVEGKYNICDYLVAIQHCSHQRCITRYRVKNIIYTNSLTIQKIKDQVVVKRPNREH